MPARLTNITYTSGDVLIPSQNLTILVGPNNAGKSATLSNIWGLITRPPGQVQVENKVIRTYNFQYPTLEEVEERLNAVTPMRPPGSYPQGQFTEPSFLSRQGQPLPQSLVNQILQMTDSKSLGDLSAMFFALLSPEARLGQLAGVQIPDLMTQEPSAPLQLLWADRGLEKIVSDYAKRAFGFEITVNRHAGANTRLHIGRPASAEPAIGTRTAYNEELKRLPEVISQGHGVQAFLGIVVTLATAAYDIVLIDEPEAFLHPPQARLLGEIFVELSRRGSQILVSTHSDDFLQGVLRAAGGSTDVTIARLTRPEEERNAVAQIEPPQVKRLYEDPLLRYSHVLSGVYYRGTVLCEAESDCNYYSAVLDAKFATEAEAVQRPDLLFAQCGGKDRFARAVAALDTMKTPTAVIADIDMIADKAQFKKLFTQMGGDWAPLEDKYTLVKDAIDRRTTSPERRAVKIVVNEIFDGATKSRLTREEVESIRDATKIQSGWSILKEDGAVAVPSGPPASAYADITAACEAVGLFLVEVGELEGWHREYGRQNKQAWLRQVFENEAYKSSQASGLLDRVVAFIAGRQ